MIITSGWKAEAEGSARLLPTFLQDFCWSVCLAKHGWHGSQPHGKHGCAAYAKAWRPSVRKSSTVPDAEGAAHARTRYRQYRINP